MNEPPLNSTASARLLRPHLAEGELSVGVHVASLGIRKIRSLEPAIVFRG